LWAAFAALLQRYTGQEDVMVGSPVANRGRPEIEGLIGFFVNTLVLRLDLAGEPSFLDLLERAHEVARGAFAHQDLPFERLVEELQPERSLSHTPLFQVLFMLQSAPAAAPTDSSDLRLSVLDVEGTTAKFDLMLSVVERRDGLQCVWELSRDLFEPPTALRMARHFETLLRGAVATPGRRAAELPLLTDAERAQLFAEWVDTAVERAPVASVAALFEARVERLPDAVAVVSDELRLSYRELDRRAEALARGLAERGAGCGAAVAVCLERTPELAVAVLGVL